MYVGVHIYHFPLKKFFLRKVHREGRLLWNDFLGLKLCYLLVNYDVVVVYKAKQSGRGGRIVLLGMAAKQTTKQVYDYVSKSIFDYEEEVKVVEAEAVEEVAPVEEAVAEEVASVVLMLIENEYITIPPTLSGVGGYCSICPLGICYHTLFFNVLRKILQMLLNQSTGSYTDITHS